MQSHTHRLTLYSQHGFHILSNASCLPVLRHPNITCRSVSEPRWCIYRRWSRAPFPPLTPTPPLSRSQYNIPTPNLGVYYIIISMINDPRYVMRRLPRSTILLYIIPKTYTAPVHYVYTLYYYYYYYTSFAYRLGV